jgi:hypothetical protein
MNNTAGIYRQLPLVLACMIAASPVWASDGHGSTNGEQVTRTIEPGKVHEECMTLTAQDQLHYSFTASENLDFNIHNHVGLNINYPIPEHSTAEADAVFVPEAEHHYCLMWTNSGSSAVELRLEHARSRRSEPAPPAK